MRKPRESKYSKMVNKYINEVFTDSPMKFKSENYLITGYDNPQKVSASGRVYRTYKIQLENAVWISTQTFNKYVKRGFFSKQVHKKIDNARMFERFNESVNNEFDPLIEVVQEETPTMKQVFEMVLSTKPTVKESVEVEVDADELHDLKTTYNLRTLKKEYKRLAKKYHTDNLDTGDVERFKLVKTIYDVRKLMIELTIEDFGYDDPDFADLVDSGEKAHKAWFNIKY